MSYNYVKAWRHRTKKRAIESLGGKCCICGYDKFFNALHFHHLDDKKKNFSLSSMKFNKWSLLVEELRKCVCVCVRCHVEIHAGVTEIPIDATRFDESYSTYIEAKEEDEMDECPICGKLKTVYKKSCSVKCANKAKEKVKIPKFEIVIMIKHGMTMESIGKMLGVSGTTIKNKLIK